MSIKTGFIPKDQKEQILKATDIVQLVGSYVQLKPTGKNYLGLCPFHQEKTPSFTVSPIYQNYKCYGCGKFGDAIRFLMEMENFQFPDAMHFLADRAGINIDYSTKVVGQSTAQTEISKCLQESFQFFRSNLINAAVDSSIHQYLKKRQISKELVERFQLGFVNPGWTNLHNILKKKSISISVQEAAGLIKKGENGNYYDRMRDRLIFPLRDSQNRILGFAGRSLGDGIPKYLNPPETELYKKSSIFYGIFEAHKTIRQNQRVIIVEGYLDVIRLHEQSWLETIAACGTALTPQHLKILKRFGAKEIYLLFDGDQPGLKAAERSARFFIENDMDSKIIVLPDNLDPDDYFKTHSKKDFQKLLDTALLDFEFVLDQAKQNMTGSGIEYQKNVVEEIIDLAEGIKASIKKDLFLAKAATVFKIEKQSLYKKSTRVLNSNSDQNIHTSQQTLPTFEKEDISQVKFLHYLITHPQAIPAASQTVEKEDFSRKDLSALYARFLYIKDEEFQTLKPQDFPELFIEFNHLINLILHHELEYRGPTINRSSPQMAALHSENEKLVGAYSDTALTKLINRLKRQKKLHDIKSLQKVADQRSSLLQMKVNWKKATGHKEGAVNQN